MNGQEMNSIAMNAKPARDIMSEGVEFYDIRMAESIDSLYQELEMLTERLAPILRPDITPRAGDEKDPGVVESRSSVSVSLSRKVNRLAELRFELSALRDRIDI